ncbi:unnamed protein product, partial [Urochloa humidicola]
VSCPAAKGILLRPPNDCSGRMLPTGKAALVHRAARWRRTWQQRHSRNCICCSGAECTAAQAYSCSAAGDFTGMAAGDFTGMAI